MSKNSITLIGGLLIVILTGSYFLFNKSSVVSVSEQETAVIGETYRLSVTYVSLRERSDNLLRHASTYPDFATWQSDLATLMTDWQTLEQAALTLETEAGKLGTGPVAQSWLPQAYAAEEYELTAIFDAAPAGQKIKTLAKHLGTDAKTAYKLLQIEQNQIEADVWNSEGDTFKDLETKAIVLKDVCKVTTYVGTIVATGGTAALATASTLSQAAVVVSGADLVLEVTSDAAQIGLGDKNQISSVINDVRIVSEPIASLLTITSLHENIGTKFEKFNAVIVGLEQFNNAAQEGKIAGVKLPVYKPGATNKQPVKVTTLTPEEAPGWLEEQGATETNPNTVSESINNAVTVAKTLPPLTVIVLPPAEKKVEGSPVPAQNSGEATGLYEGVMTWTASAGEEPSSQTVVFELVDDGTIVSNDGDWASYHWKVEDGFVRVFDPANEANGYHEFTLSGNTLTFIKIAGPDEEGTWSEVFAGDDFFGGKYMTLTMKRQ